MPIGTRCGPRLRDTVACRARSRLTALGGRGIPDGRFRLHTISGCALAVRGCAGGAGVGGPERGGGAVGAIGQAYGFCLFFSTAAFRLAMTAVERRGWLVPFGAGLAAGSALAGSLLTAPLAPVLLLWLLIATAGRAMEERARVPGGNGPAVYPAHTAVHPRAAATVLRRGEISACCSGGCTGSRRGLTIWTC